MATVLLHNRPIRKIAIVASQGRPLANHNAEVGHRPMSRRMLEQYSHVRMATKRLALEELESGLMGGASPTSQPESTNGGRDRTRTCDLLRVKFPTLAISLSTKQIFLQETSF